MKAGNTGSGTSANLRAVDVPEPARNLTRLIKQVADKQTIDFREIQIGCG